MRDPPYRDVFVRRHSRIENIGCVDRNQFIKVVGFCTISERIAVDNLVESLRITRINDEGISLSERLTWRDDERDHHADEHCGNYVSHDYSPYVVNRCGFLNSVNSASCITTSGTP